MVAKIFKNLTLKQNQGNDLNRFFFKIFFFFLYEHLYNNLQADTNDLDITNEQKTYSEVPIKQINHKCFS